jgi:hypothetical protein
MAKRKTAIQMGESALERYYAKEENKKKLERRSFGKRDKWRSLE